jgi:hypothetical protein
MKLLSKFFNKNLVFKVLKDTIFSLLMVRIQKQEEITDLFQREFMSLLRLIKIVII